jgi:hypothetical protein
VSEAVGAPLSPRASGAMDHKGGAVGDAQGRGDAAWAPSTREERNVTEEQELKYELRVTQEPDEEGVYWARIFVNGIWNRSFHSEDRQEAIAAARRYVDWKQGAGQEEEVIDLTRPPVEAVTVRVVFDLETGLAPFPLGVYDRTDEDVIVYRTSSGREYRAPDDCVAVVSVTVPWRAAS